MRVLVACEFSGVVREAFRERGHDAWSVDLLPTEVPGQHIVGDAMEAAYGGSWDILIAHPPCTHLASSGARWFKDKAEQQKQALEFFLKLAKAPVPRICLENPVGVASRLDRRLRPFSRGSSGMGRRRPPVCGFTGCRP